MKIPLFDIDGTLVKTANPVHKTAFSYAFENVYKIKAIDNEINPEGMTDNQIIVEVLKIHGLKEDFIKKNIKQATETINRYFHQHINDAEIVVLDGVIDLLTSLKAKDAVLGLLSGNVEGIAWAKLQRAEIKKYFDFGAFG
ncbi:MAG TPA: HAD hydrolase-like protein, partial [Candidatus Sulfotelmatobacter sp.]|nr:HAD hydrolase-like protein [Candidatus Sulfotelmatobacter sp.]